MMVPFSEYHLMQLLKRFDHQHLPLDLFLSNYFRAHSALGSKDRQKIAEAAYGMARWRGLIDYLIGAQRSWENRFNLYKGFQPDSYLTATHIPLHIRVSFPEALFNRLVAQYGEAKAAELATISNSAAPTTVRVNALKTTREVLLARWSRIYDVCATKDSPYGILFKKRENFFGMAEFKEGLFEVQDEASQLVSLMVQPRKGAQVLDYCSGSGGKSLAIAPRLGGTGQIYLHDIRPAILDQARKRLRRAGVQNAQLLSSDHPALERLRGKMDWVLVDAPCSGSGTLRRNPDLKWKFSEEKLLALVQQQREIFEKALSYLAPNGYIVWATCSILAEENEKQVEGYMKEHDLQLVGPAFTSLPVFGGYDGFFATILKRRSAHSPDHIEARAP